MTGDQTIRNAGGTSGAGGVNGVGAVKTDVNMVEAYDAPTRTKLERASTAADITPESGDRMQLYSVGADSPVTPK